MSVIVQPRPATSLAPDSTGRPNPALVAASLARIEARQLLRSPLLWSGFLFSGLMVFQETSWHDVVDLHNAGGGVFYALLPAATTLLATNRAVLRSKRDGTEELFAATATSPRLRTGGLLLALVVPLALAIVLASAWVTILFTFRETFGRPVLADVLRGPVLVVGAGALGVMLGRWVRSSLVGPVACVAIAASILTLQGPSFTTSSLAWLSLYPAEAAIPVVELVMPRPHGWHLVYLIGLVGLASLGALLREGLDRPMVAASVLTLVAVGVAAFAQTRPLTAADWAARDALISDPAGHQVCQDRGRATYCHFPRYGPLVDWWAQPVEGVTARLPDDAGPVLVRQHIRPGDYPWLAHDNRTRLLRVLPSLPGASTPLPDGAAVVNSFWETNGPDELALAWDVASASVGLPRVPLVPRRPCDAAGQGRAAVALWLTGQATPLTRQTLEEVLDHNVWLRGGTRLVPLRHDNFPGGAAIGKTDASLAVAMLERPPEQIADLLASHWSQITDPSFDAAALAALLGPDWEAPPTPRPTSTLGEPCT